MLIHALKVYNPDITALQEIQWKGVWKIQNPEGGLYYSCHEQQHIFGTGFLVGTRVKNKIIAFTPVDMRICTLRVKCKLYNISIINVYAPNEDKEDIEKELFYELLERTYENCPKNGLKIIIGDMNAKVGRDKIYRKYVSRHSAHEKTNDNGTRLINFAASRDMILGSTRLERKNIYKYTWQSANRETQNQIEHMLSDPRHINNLLDIRTYKNQTLILIITYSDLKLE
jgi:exonuclease III